MRNIISNLRFFPKTHDFFGFFEKSIENSIVATQLLCKMISTHNERPVLSRRLKEYEHVGDEITHEIIDLLHQTFLTPFDRGDMYQLAAKLDDIMDIVYYTGNRLTRYNILEIPKEIPYLANLVLQSTENLSKALTGLRNMKNSDLVLHHCTEVNRLEKEADEQVDLVIEDIFHDSQDALKVIKIKEIVEHLEAATDRCEDVADIIEGIILKHA